MGTYIESLRVWLLERGYTPGSIKHVLTLAGQLGRWMEGADVKFSQLDSAAVAEAAVRSPGARPTWRPPIRLAGCGHKQDASRYTCVRRSGGEMRPSSVAAWSGVELLRALPGGARNQVLLARRGDRQLVVRRSTRSAASLEWELDLLEYLAGHGIGVPRTVPANDGRRHVHGVLVQEFVAGRPPRTDDDWHRVVQTVTAVHQLTVGWPQRPGFASARQLLVADRGGDVHLDAMPAEAVRAVRRAWQPILTGPECAVHGDMGAGNVLVADAQVTLLDWDEARVDVAWFDFAFLPATAIPVVPVPVDTVITAGLAWETATCWLPEPDYARRRLAELYARSDPA